MKTHTFLTGCITVAASLAASTAVGDVTMTQKFNLEAGGFLAMLAAEGTIETSISNDRSRTETEANSKSNQPGMAQAMTGVSIDRLDKGVNWDLNPDKKQFSEMTYRQKRAQLKEQTQQGAKGGSLPVSEDDCQWSDPILEVKKTGEKQRFANVKADQHLIIVQETCTVPQSGKRCEVTWVVENWMARRMPAADEIGDFHAALARELGVEEAMSGMPASSQAMMSMFEEGWEEAMDEAGDLEGFPVKTVMQFEMGGDACTTSNGQSIAMDDVWGDAAYAGARAGASTAGYHTRHAVAREATRAMGGGAAGSVAGSAAGAATGEVVSGLLGHFSKKKKAPPPEPAAQPESAPGTATTAGSAIIFRVSSELVAIEESGVPADQFEVPAGWKQVKP